MTPSIDTSLTIEISDTQKHLRVDRAWLRSITARVLGLQQVRQASLSLVLVDNPTIQQINCSQLQHDWPTDVITFPLSEPNSPCLSAELVLSTEMAVETARAAGTDPAHELALYLVHGLLHLCGHDDLNEAQRALMREREAQVLHELGLPCLFDRLTPEPATSDTNPLTAAAREAKTCSA